MKNVPKLVAPSGHSNTQRELSSDEIKYMDDLSKMINPIDAGWADQDCLHRYLRACKMDVSKAATRIAETGKWRREFKPDSIRPEDVENEAFSGKHFLNGFDKEGRPIWYLIPSRENTKAGDNQIRFVVYTLEKAIKLMPRGVESLVIILDYADMGILNAPSPGTGRKFMSILSEHYPERLGRAFVVNPTWYIWTFFTLLGPFLDPVTKAKVHLISREKEDGKESAKHNLKQGAITDYIESDQLLKEYDIEIMIKGAPILSPPEILDAHDLTLAQEEVFLINDLSKMINPIDAGWADQDCLHRYLRACKMDVSKAATRIAETGKWRREFKPDSIRPEDVAKVAQAGRQFLCGFDKKGRPIWYMVPSRKSENHSVDDQIRFVVFTIEKAIKLMPQGVESLVIIIDYSNMSLFNSTSPGTGRKFLHILSEHYPERLGLAFIVNPTWYLWTFFTLLGPFLDPVTKAKIHLLNMEKADEEESKKHNLKQGKITDFVSKDQLLVEYGGSHSFEWDFNSYWTHLNR